MKDDPVVIVGAARTPIAGFGGGFADMTAPELGAAAISGALAKAGLAAADVEERAVVVKAHEAGRTHRRQVCIFSPLGVHGRLSSTN